MRWLMILPGVLVVLYVVFLLLSRGQVQEVRAILVDRVRVDVTCRYGSKLPKFFGHAATTINHTICFRCYPPGYPIRVVGRPPIFELLAANEVFHVVDRVRRGFWGHWGRIVVQILQHPFSHDARPYEAESTRAAAMIVQGTYPGVDAVLFLVPYR